MNEFLSFGPRRSNDLVACPSVVGVRPLQQGDQCTAMEEGVGNVARLGAAALRRPTKKYGRQRIDSSHMTDCMCEREVDGAAAQGRGGSEGEREGGKGEGRTHAHTAASVSASSSNCIIYSFLLSLSGQAHSLSFFLSLSRGRIAR